MRRRNPRRDVRMMRCSSHKMWLLVAATVVFTTVALSAQSPTTTVRGRVDRETPDGKRPAVSVPLTLYSEDAGRSAVVYTGRDGMYYFRRVPLGDYELEVWARGRKKEPLRHSIRVASRPYTDIAPVLIPADVGEGGAT